MLPKLAVWPFMPAMKESFFQVLAAPERGDTTTGSGQLQTLFDGALSTIQHFRDHTHSSNAFSFGFPTVAVLEKSACGDLVTGWRSSLGDEEATQSSGLQISISQIIMDDISLTDHLLSCQITTSPSPSPLPTTP